MLYSEILDRIKSKREENGQYSQAAKYYVSLAKNKDAILSRDIRINFEEITHNRLELC